MTSGTKELSKAWPFVRSNKWAILCISAVLIAPCFWHRHIEAGDLASHMYNAWLAQLIEKGQAPGLYFVRQWDNVLFDWMILHAANLFGFAAAGKIVVSACVLIFFWGVFAFVAAASGNAPWYLTPCFAMLAYGYSFNMGFINYYLSLGSASFGLALLWRGRGLERGLGVIIAPLVFLAHPLGFLWLGGTVLYLGLWSKLPNWWKLAVPVAATGAVYCLRLYLAHQNLFPVDWVHDPFYLMNGADQLTLYGDRYATLGWTALVFGAFCVVTELILRRKDMSIWRSLGLPAGMYAVAIFSVALLPQNLRPSITGGWIGLLASRLTAITAIFGLCVMSCLKPRKWHLAGFGACAIVFFTFLYQDTLVLDHMESTAKKLVSQLPFGTRVIETIWSPDDSRISFIGHMVDRACIGRCFSYANYEPASGQFRIRVRQGSPIVSASDDDNEDMQSGEYTIQERDLPMVEIYQCDAKDLTQLCMRDLAAGEKNGRVGYKPPD